MVFKYIRTIAQPYVGLWVLTKYGWLSRPHLFKYKEGRDSDTTTTEIKSENSDFFQASQY